ncbi:EamA family transporter RarD [Aestuariivirga sp.]|uniref:EamA family transporter RarD n=1 Tax=Aestuariivirga sp. TaxID=2650926 RepID=UPI003784553F
MGRDRSAVSPTLTAAETGVVLAVMAHLVWGGMAFYFGLIRHISPVEIAVNRGFWALPVAVLVVWYLGQWPDVRRALTNPRHVAILALTSSLIVFNWGFYVWSIEVGRTLESSLGYFINPLLNVVMGYLFLGERFTSPQKVALGLACVGVIVQTVALGYFPWLGLMLAVTFCLYGFLRKTIPVGPTQGFLIEVLIAALPLLAAEWWLAERGEARFAANGYDTLMLMGCGVMTAVSLMLYAASIRRIRYSTAGLLQYISPSLVFLTAVFIFGEQMNVLKLVSFVIIWIALAIFSWTALRDERLRREAEA